jgi:hypothetical protein
VALRTIERDELVCAHQRQTGQHGQEADGVQREADADAEGGDDHAGEGGPDDARRVEEARVQRYGIRELVTPDHLERERVAARRIEDQRGAGGGGEHVGEPDDLGAGEGEHGQHSRDAHRRALGHHHLAAVVEAVGDDAGDQPEHGERGEAAKREEADGDGGVGQFDHVPRERDVLHPGADERDHLAGEEEAVVAVLADAGERPARKGEDGRGHWCLFR